MARKNMTDYPTAWGDKKVSMIVHDGPVLYAPIVQDTPSPSGGDVVTAQEFGLKSIDAVFAMGSDNGQYDVVAFAIAGNPVSSFGGLPCAGVTLMWRVAATGAEAAAIDLSARSVKLLAVGPK
jgi:hypothetical protein